MYFFYVIHLQSGIQLQCQYRSDVEKMDLYFIKDMWFPKSNASAFQTQADKCMLMCWRDLKSQMRQPIFSDQSCVTKPEWRLFPLFLHGAGMTSIIKWQF